MDKLSLKVQQLKTLYGAPDWLINTNQGQQYLYDMAKKIWEDGMRNNQPRVVRHHDVTDFYHEQNYNILEELEQTTNPQRIQELQERYKINQQNMQNYYDDQGHHMVMDRVLKELKFAIDTLNYNQMILIIDKLISIAHHGGTFLTYVQEREPQELEELEDVMYQKFGDNYYDILNSTNQLPEDPLKYNKQTQQFQKINPVNNFISMIVNAKKSYAQLEQEIEQYKQQHPEIEEPIPPKFQEKVDRLQNTLNYATKHLFSTYSDDYDQLKQEFWDNPNPNSIFYKYLCNQKYAIQSIFDAYMETEDPKMKDFLLHEIPTFPYITYLFQQGLNKSNIIEISDKILPFIPYLQFSESQILDLYRTEKDNILQVLKEKNPEANKIISEIEELEPKVQEILKTNEFKYNFWQFFDEESFDLNKKQNIASMVFEIVKRKFKEAIATNQPIEYVANFINPQIYFYSPQLLTADNNFMQYLKNNFEKKDVILQKYGEEDRTYIERSLGNVKTASKIIKIANKLDGKYPQISDKLENILIKWA